MKTLRLYAGILRDSLKSLPRLFAIYKLTLKEVRDEGENIKTFIFASKRKVRFQAGQYGIWFMPRFIKGKPARLFTVAAAPGEDTVQVSTRIGPSDFKQKLSRLKPGDTVYVDGPIGEFVLPKILPEHIVFVAGGIGITPIRSLSKHIHDNALPVKTTLVHSADGYYLYQDELKGYVDTAHFTTRENFDATLQQLATERPNAIYYLSGPPGFVEVAHNTLAAHGVKHIRTDAFLGY